VLGVACLVFVFEMSAHTSWQPYGVHSLRNGQDIDQSARKGIAVMSVNILSSNYSTISY
jgi:hypothetical protein